MATIAELRIAFFVLAIAADCFPQALRTTGWVIKFMGLFSHCKKDHGHGDPNIRVKKLQILNIPNLLTLARIIITPFIVYLILVDEIWMALALMAVAGFTDMLDGLIARYWNMQTTVGAYLDPLADKMMLISMIVTLFIVDHVPLFIFLAIIFRDVIIVIGAVTYELLTHHLEVKPSLASKATTLAQIIYVLALLLNIVHPLEPMWMTSIAWITFILTCVSGVHYLVFWTIKAINNEQEHD